MSFLIITAIAGRNFHISDLLCFSIWSLYTCCFSAGLDFESDAFVLEIDPSSSPTVDVR